MAITQTGNYSAANQPVPIADLQTDISALFNKINNLLQENLSANSVGAAQIQNNAVTTAKILNANITSAKIANGAGGGGYLLTTGDIFISVAGACPAGTTRFAGIDNKFLVSAAAYNAAAGGKNTIPLTTGLFGIGGITAITQVDSSTASFDNRPEFATILLCQVD